MAAERVVEAASLDEEVASNLPDGLAIGNLKMAAEPATPETTNAAVPIRREAFIAIFGVMLGLLVDPIRVRIGIGTGSLALEEAEKATANAGRITSDDIRSIEDALSSGSLQNHAESLAASGRHTVAKLIRALASHVTGDAPQVAKATLDELLRGDLDSSVRSFLLFRRAKVRVLTGEVTESLVDLDQSLSMIPITDISRRLEKLRQAAVHAYISTPFGHCVAAEQWQRMEKYLREAMHLLDWDRTTAAPVSISMALDKVPIVSLGVLFLHGLRKASLRRGDPDPTKLVLRESLKVLQAWHAFEPIASWNSYTPLAAQAISLGHFDVARETLALAANLAITENTSPVSRYASAQRRSCGVEWLFHRLQVVALQVNSAYTMKRAHDRQNACNDALTILKEIFVSPYPQRTILLLRAAKLYQREISQMLHRRFDTASATVEAYNSPAYSHWTYFPRLKLAA